MTQIYSRLVATGSALPERIVTNADLEKIVSNGMIHEELLEAIRRA